MHPLRSVIEVFVFLRLLSAWRVGSLTLTGNEGSHARFPAPWMSVTSTCDGQDGSVSFDFRSAVTLTSGRSNRTATPRDVLLWYYDTGSQFIQLSLNPNSGHVVLLMKLAGHVSADQSVRAELPSASDRVRLDDNKWHSVNVQRDSVTTTLTVDKWTTSINHDILAEVEGQLPSSSERSSYFGGLPIGFLTDSRLTELAAPSAAFLGRFRGYIRNVIYGRRCVGPRDGGGGPVAACPPPTVFQTPSKRVSWRPVMIDGQVVRRANFSSAIHDEPQCADQRDPCRQTGCICISTDQVEPRCDCSVRVNCSFYNESEWVTSTTTPSLFPVVPPVQGQWMTFNGSTWIMVDMSKMPGDFLRSNKLESFNVTFSTSRADQLIWFTGNDWENLHLTLKDGILYLTVAHNGREDQTMRVQSDRRLDDNRVHQVSVTRRGRRITVTIDGQATVNTVKYLPYDTELIGQDNAVFLGGNADTSRLTQRFVSENFVGTVRKAVLSGDTLPHDIDVLGLALIQPTPAFIVINGQLDDYDDEMGMEATEQTRRQSKAVNKPSSSRPVENDDDELDIEDEVEVPRLTTPTTRQSKVVSSPRRFEHDDDELDIEDEVEVVTTSTRRQSKDVTSNKGPTRRGATSVTFNSGRSYVRQPVIWTSKFNGTVEFSFRTLESDGLLMLTSPRGPRHRDFFAVELVDGALVALYNFGSERTLKFVLGSAVNDGRPHRVQIVRDGRQFFLTFDNEEQYDIIGAEVDDISLDLGTTLYVGGTDDSTKIPWPLISRRRERFYRGCLWDVRFDDSPSLELMQIDQPISGIQSGCVPAETGRCSQGGPDGQRFCQHRGACHERWSGPVCDCSRIAYTGPQCQNDAPLIALYGGAGDLLKKSNVRPKAVTHRNDISVHFRTAKTDGVIFATSNSGDDGYVKAYMEDGQVLVEFHIPGAENDVQLTTRCDYPVNDNEWHILNIKRRAGEVEANVDSCRPADDVIRGEDFSLEVDQITVGKVNENEPLETSFVGNVRNLVVDNSRPFDRHRSESLVNPTTTPKVILSTLTTRPVQPPVKDDDTVVPDDPVSFPPNYNAYIRVTADPVRKINDQQVRFLFRTNERQGLLAYSTVRDEGWYLAVELRDGVPRVDYDDGSVVDGPTVFVAPSDTFVSDGEWHEFHLKSAGPRTNQLLITVDNVDIGVRIDVASPLLFQSLYIGGLPEGRPDRISKRAVGGESVRRGFVGCVSVLAVNGRRFDLMEAAAKSDVIKPGCMLDAPADHCGEHQCQHRGICVQQLNGYVCDCNLTSLTGPYCDFEAEGFIFGENLGPGVVIYTLKPPRYTDTDKVAFGLMTRQMNGTLLRLDSGIVDFIEFKLENGYLVVQYDLGNSEQRLVETRIKLNDGLYHYVTYVRNRSSVTLQVDDLPVRKKIHDHAAMMFNHLVAVKIGGHYDIHDQIVNPFDGIISGVFVSDDVSQDRVIDKHVFERSDNIIFEGDVKVAEHPFTLPVRRITTKPPVEPIIPEAIKEPDIEPNEINGGQIDVDGEPILPPDPEIPVDEGLTGFGLVHAGDGPQKAHLAGAAVGFGGGGLDVTGTRAAAVAGAMLGVLAAIMSLAWAMYHLKPDSIRLPWYRRSDAGKTMIISAPQDATMRLLSTEKAAPVTSGFTVGQSAVTLIRGTDDSKGTLKNSAQHVTISVPERSEDFGTLTKHRAIQTEVAENGHIAGNTSRSNSRDAAGGFSASYIESTFVKNVYTSQHPSNAAATGGDEVELFQSNSYLTSSPIASTTDASVFHMTNMALGTTATMAVTNLMTTAEQIRVDCVQLTTNGRFVVTGSVYGPPQVWDLKTGELVNMMAGEELSSTDLHLANGDTLLVGQVAEVEQVDSSDIAAANRLHYRKLQIWDFETGRPMEMRKNESCTASCMMTDGERMVLGRTERFSTGITVVIWDVLGNEPLRYLKYDSATGISDHVCYVGVSRDNRYVVTGYQNSYDGRANFVIFDLSEYDVTGPKVLALTAVVDVTAILDNQEAITGTLAGELVIWSLRTGKVLRQLVPPGGTVAHDREVKALAVSKDVSLLVSASADSTLKIWNIENDQLQMTLRGHRDEVWCCAISNDNELVVSGSRDRTIRLWRTSDGTAAAAIDAGVDVFKVLISNNKRTVVALADRHAARKLIMLQIVRSKTLSVSGSRSPAVN